VLVIADENKPIALAGVMGGVNSEVDSNTKTIVIESANFDSVSIRRTSWKLGLRTEAAIRFEKGLPINFPEEGLFRVVDLIKKLAGGEVVSIVFDETSQKARKDMEKRKKILLSPERANKFIGLDVSRDKIVNILESLEFKTEELNLKSRLVKLAKKQLGKPYKFGASTYLEAPEIFDCSSLTRYLFRQIGIEIPRRSIEQFKFGQFKELGQLQIGDLIFSKSQRRKRGGKVFKGTGHVGIIVGKNQIIHASSKMGKVVQISLKNFLTKKSFTGVRQILPYDRGLVVTAPIFRPDVTCQEDLIEEIVRIFGFNKVIPRPIKGEMALTGLNKELLAERKIKNILVGLGFDEVYNYSFYSKDKLTEPDAEKKHLQLINPLNPDQEYLRTSLLPRLLDNAAKNARNFNQFRIFEVGKVYTKNKKGIEEKKMVAGAIYKKSKEKLFYLVKGAVEVLLDRMGIDMSKINWRPLGNKSVGVWFGQELIGLVDAGFFELDLQKLLIKLVEVEPRPFEPIPAYPPAVRDLGFVVDKSVTYKDLVEAIQKTDSLIKKVELFDVYQSDKLGKNKKNLAFRLTFQAVDRTLKLKEVDQIQSKIVKKLEDKFGAKLRTF
jgi:phenylalanyl-tRNA synthetase beta subunit